MLLWKSSSGRTFWAISCHYQTNGNNFYDYSKFSFHPPFFHQDGCQRKMWKLQILKGFIEANISDKTLLLSFCHQLMWYLMKLLIMSVVFFIFVLTYSKHLTTTRRVSCHVTYYSSWPSNHTKDRRLNILTNQNTSVGACSASKLGSSS